MKVAIIYRRADGKIMRVSSLTKAADRGLTEKNIQAFFPGVDVSHLAMVFIEGKEYLDIEKYRVELDDDGGFKEVVEALDTLTDYKEDVEVAEELLDREAAVVVSVLSVIDDKERLLKYKQAEIRGRNRAQVMNFFKERRI